METLDNLIVHSDIPETQSKKIISEYVENAYQYNLKQEELLEGYVDD